MKNDNKKIGFVVLNYLNFDVTSRCVKNLLKLRGIELCEIVIVDNGSPNNSYEALSLDLCQNPNVTIIRNEENLGYSKGNNVGFTYLREEKGCDTIIILNSDAFILNADFIELLNKYRHSNSNDYVIAPDIINLDGSHINPGKAPIYDKNYFRKVIFKNKILILLLKMGLIKHPQKRKEKTCNNLVSETLYSYFIPHGSCLIFMPNWVKTENKAFCNKTFLFLEERFLLCYIESREYTLRFEPTLKVLHEEDGSINSFKNKSREKSIFVLKNQNMSLKSFIRFLDDPISKW